MGVSLRYPGPIMCTNSPDSINLWAPWRRVPRITPLNYAAQGTILEVPPFAKSVECCLVQINSQIHSWLTSLAEVINVSSLVPTVFCWKVGKD